MLELQAELPGLEVTPTRTGQETDIVKATQLAIADLNATGLIEQRHFALLQLALDQARMLEKALADPQIRLTAVTGLMDSYRETMAALPVPAVAANGKFEAFLASLPSAQQVA